MEDSELRVVGYILIELAVVPDFLEIGRPEGLVLAPTECICKFHPPYHALSWFRGDADDAYIDSFNLELSEALSFQECVDLLFDSKLWGCDGVFTSLDSAFKFKNKYLFKRNDIILIGLAVSSNYLQDFLERSCPPRGFVTQGVHWCASLNLSVPAERITLGYETVSVNGCGEMHTSMCYGIRPDFVRDFEAQFNKNGFMTTLEVAQQGAKANADIFLADSGWYGVEVFIPHVSSSNHQETQLEEAYKGHALE